MKVPNHVNSADLRFNMTPMIDVVFLLIIFFLLSSHLARRENNVELALPTAKSGENPWDEDAPRVTLNVLPDGTLIFAGQTTTLDNLDGKLVAARQRLGTRTELRIRADRDVAYRHVSPILDAAARNGIWSVTFAVIGPNDARNARPQRPRNLASRSATELAALPKAGL